MRKRAEIEEKLMMEETVRLHTGREMPGLGLGTWELTEATADTVAHAIRLGYGMIDTAADYGSQRGIGEALRHPAVDRQAIFLVAKVEEDEDAYEATGRYLAEMRQERAEVMLIHRPPEQGVGVELWEGLVRARDAGLTRDIGVSNYSIAALEELIGATGEVPVVNQIEWSPFGWSRRMLDYCRRRGIVVQGYSPLTRGRRLEDDRLARIAAAHGATPAQILIAWAREMGVVPLPKANRWDHLEENLGAQGIRIGKSERKVLEELNEGYSALGDTLQYL